MRNRLVLAAAAIGLLCFGSGCSALILHVVSKGGESPSQLSVGATRDDVEAKLGRPVTVRPLPDGGQVAIYEYRLPDPKAQEMATRALGQWLPLCQGAPCGILTEPLFFFPYAIYKAATPPRGKVTFTYGPDGRLLYLGSPPPYGPVDDAVEMPSTGTAREAYGLIDAIEAPSIGTIRESCRLRDRGESPEHSVGAGGKRLTAAEIYVDCVSSRFAIWAIE